MAIIIKGITTCKICGLVINELDEEIGFPPFVVNEREPNYFFSDNAFHRKCFLQNPSSREIPDLLKQYDQGIDHKVCYISGETLNIDNIYHPDNAIFLGLLSSDLNSEISKLNFKYLNKFNLKKWLFLDEFINSLKEMIESDSHNQGLQYILTWLDSPPTDPIGARAD